MKIRCIIVDDEPLASDGIRLYSEKIEFFELKGIFDNAMKANAFLLKNDIDLVFTDIHMPMLSGIEWIKNIPGNPMVIFTTAHPDYALQGYEVNALDYLLKPVSFERFFNAANKALNFFSAQQVNLLPSHKTVEEDYVFIRCDGKFEKIYLKKIIFIEGLKDYVKIQTETFAVPIITAMNLKTIGEKLPSSIFLRTHKSFLVNVHKVNSMDSYSLNVGSYSVPIGDSYRNQVQKVLLDGKLLKR